MAKPPKRSVTRAREAMAWDLNVRGKTCREIAAILIEQGLGPITFQAVSHMLIRVGNRHTAELTEKVSTYKAKQAELLDLLIDEALKGLGGEGLPERERRVRTVTIKARRGADEINLPAKEVTRTTRWRDGDPRFLAEARAAAADIRKLFGLDASPSDPAPGQGDPDPAAARRALMAAETEPEPPIHIPGDDDGPSDVPPG